MSITLYTTNCPKCKVIEKKLNDKKLFFNTIDNVDIVVEVGEEHGIMSAPILQVDDEFMDFSKANKWINEL